MSSCSISVIVPVYNAEKYILRCIASITSQNFSDFEIICVDDASSDSSYQILNELALTDNRIKLYRNLENRGAGYTKNYAISKAVGEYLCFVDSDDWIVDGTLKTLYENAVGHNVEDVFYLFFNMSEMGRNLESETTIWRSFSDKESFSGLSFLNKMLDERCLTFSAAHHFVKRSVVLGRVYFSEATVCDDMLFSCNVLANLNSVLFYKKELYVYFHRTTGSVTKSANSVRRANEMVLLGLSVYGTISKLASAFAKEVARKLLKYSVLVAANKAMILPDEEKNDFISIIFAEAACEGQYVTLSKDSLSKLSGTVYIYGTGGYAVDIYRQLLERKCDISAFIVTKAEKKEFLGKQVFGISDFPVPENATLIIGTSEKFYDEILAEPKVKQFAQVILARDL